ncbi:MAG TPA: acyl carrier protein [Terriglobia bacterium]|jgi:acyl carrier protein|nr:acyl carrier protein [Terriglobia bacterium]
MELREMTRTMVADLLSNKGDRSPFEDADSLIVSGRLQSLDAVSIALFLEREYGIDFSRVGFDQTQIDSVDAIVGLIERERHA